MHLGLPQFRDAIDEFAALLMSNTCIEQAVRHLTGYQAGHCPARATTRSMAGSDGHIAGSVVHFGHAARHHACSDSGDWVVKGPRRG